MRISSAEFQNSKSRIPVQSAPFAFASGRFRRFPGCMETKHKPQHILSPQQETVLEQLLPIARIATSGAVTGLPFRPRSHTLLVGPSGAGKSYIALELGRRLNIPVLLINASSWVVLSAKNEPWTASAICEWLDSLGNGGGVLVLDEIDKLQADGDHWKSYIRLEVHDFLDGVIPHAARMPKNPYQDDWESTATVDAQTRTMLTARLRDKVYVLGCGAWQSAWTANSKKIGFGAQASKSEKPSRSQILEAISPEIRQRFRDQICWLEPMTSNDYETASARIADTLPSADMAKIWNRLARSAIERAITGGLGMRVFEELMLTVVLEMPEHPVHDYSKLNPPEPLV